MDIIFMGRKKYSAQLLEWIINQNINIVAVVTDSHFINSPTTIKAKQLAIPVVSQEEAENLVKKVNIDLVVSYLYWNKIKEPMISTPRYGCINFHPAILPDWRGCGGYNLAILNKLNKWGTTAHYVDSSFDTGNIIKIYDFPFDHRIETAYSLEQKTQQLQVDLFKSVILDVKQHGLLNSYVQDTSNSVYISRSEMESMKLIDPINDDIDLKIRAFWFPPYNGAYVDLNGTKYTVINKDILKLLSNDDTTSNA